MKNSRQPFARLIITRDVESQQSVIEFRSRDEITAAIVTLAGVLGGAPSATSEIADCSGQVEAEIWEAPRSLRALRLKKARLA